MPSSLILPLIFDAATIEAGGFLVAATTFAIRLVTTYALTSLLIKNPTQSSPQGTEIQLGPNTDNKLPVIYGSRYCKPIVTDAIISTDQKTMWYVLSLSEAPTFGEFSVGEVYYDGKLLIFDPLNPNEITGWYTQPKKHSKVGGQYNTKPAGKLSMYFYRNGSLSTGTVHLCYDMIDQGGGNFDIGTASTGTTTIDAISLLQDAAIPAETQWTTATTMNNATFAVIRLNYDQGAGIYGLGGMDIRLTNPVTQNPGYAIYDYLTNISYGCGIPAESVDIPSLLFLDKISSYPLTIVDTNNTTVTNTWTYQVNGIVDTTQDCLTNLNNISDACDSWIQWNEKVGQWGVIPNISIDQYYAFLNQGTTSTVISILDNNLITTGSYVIRILSTSSLAADIPSVGAELSHIYSDYFVVGTTVTNVISSPVYLPDINYPYASHFDVSVSTPALQPYAPPPGEYIPITFINNPEINPIEARILSTTTMRVISSDHIIGGINLTPSDLKASANKISIAFPNSDIINQTDYRYYFLKQDRPELISPNEPDNNIDINMPFVTDPLQATYLGYRKLFMSREDIAINFSMDYSGIGINAGDIVAIQHEWYGWSSGEYNGLTFPGKPFRITQVKEAKDNSGFLGVQIVASAYNDSLYKTMNPHYYTPDQFGLNVDTINITQPGSPVTPASATPTPEYPNSSFPFFVVSSRIPTGGIITAIELWAGLTTTIDSTWQPIMTINNPSGAPFPNSTPSVDNYVNFDVASLQAGSFYFATRAYNNSTYSVFSDPSSPVYVWAPAIQAGTAVVATNANNVAMNAGAGEFYITHSLANSGNSAQYANSLLKYNATSNVLSTPSINISNVAQLTPLSSPPASPTTGMLAMADNITWHPVIPQTNTGTAYLTVYNGSSWVKLG
jgi:hypothetical protein